MKRYLAIFLTLLMTLCMCVGCADKSGDPTVSDPSNVPAEATDSPSPSVETPAPTDEFTSVEIVPDTTLEADIDGDGLADAIFLDYAAYDEYSASYTLSITLGKSPESTYTDDTFSDAYSLIFASVIDCDSTDSRREIVLNYNYSSDDTALFAYRVNADGVTIDRFAEEAYVHGYQDGILTYSIDSTILGSCGLKADYTIDADGFKMLSDAYTWVYAPTLIVIAELPVTIVDDADNSQYASTAIPGSTVTPIETDGQSYIYVSLSTGENAYIYIAVGETSSLIYIDNQLQDHYFDLVYAD